MRDFTSSTSPFSNILSTRLLILSYKEARSPPDKAIISYSYDGFFISFSSRFPCVRLISSARTTRFLSFLWIFNADFSSRAASFSCIKSAPFSSYSFSRFFRILSSFDVSEKFIGYRIPLTYSPVPPEIIGVLSFFKSSSIIGSAFSRYSATEKLSLGFTKSMR